jgi:hypothetical protein
MATRVGNILRRAYRTGRMRVLYLPDEKHPDYQSILLGADHDFFKIPSSQSIGLYFGFDFDLIISQSRLRQLPSLLQQAQYSNLPILSIEHDVPSPAEFQQFAMLPASYHVFSSKESKLAWQINTDVSLVTIQAGVPEDVIRTVFTKMITNVANRPYWRNSR